MARIYAGILGLLAFATVMARGTLHASAPGATIWQAVSMLFAFAAVGWAIGRTGQWIVDDAVRSRLASHMPTKAAGEPES